jgi:hypothetical protein
MVSRQYTRSIAIFNSFYVIKNIYFVEGRTTGGKNAPYMSICLSIGM